MQINLSLSELAMVCHALHSCGDQLKNAETPEWRAMAASYQALAGDLPARIPPAPPLRLVKEDEKEYPTAAWPASERNPSWSF